MVCSVNGKCFTEEAGRGGGEDGEQEERGVCPLASFVLAYMQSYTTMYCSKVEIALHF